LIIFAWCAIKPGTVSVFHRQTLPSIS
jgi:hypothetical protein